MHCFKSPVTIRWERGMQEIRDVEAALEAMKGWPRKGPKLRAAYVVCAEVLDGTKTADDAREAFVRAAKEAKVLRGH